MKKEKDGAQRTAKPDKALCRPYTKQFFKGNKLNFFITACANILMAVMELAIPWVLQHIVDYASGENDIFDFWDLVFLTLGVIGLFLLAELLRYIFKPLYQARAMRQYKDHAFSSLTGKSISSFSKENTSDYISALSNDLAIIENDYVVQLFIIPERVTIFLGAVALMLWYSPVLTAISFGFALLPVVSSLLTGNRIAPKEKAVSDMNASFMDTLKDSLSGFSIIKSFKAERSLARIFAERNKAAEDAKIKRNRLRVVLDTISYVALSASQLGVMLVGALLVVKFDIMTVGMLIAFSQLMNYMVEPLFFFPDFRAKKKAVYALIEKFARAASDNVRDEGTEVSNELLNAIEIKNVSFSYDGETNALNDINLRFNKGESYAVVGPSGSGKSTLLNLLMAAHNEYKGNILYDGTELRNINAASLYDMISIVQQNVFIFNSSVRDNITMFSSFPDEEVKNAIDRAGLSDMIKERGEDYMCGENGAGLSGGERQRIAVARSLLKKTSVLLADEATAALDKETAFNVMNSILGLEDFTRIVVTHAMDRALLSKYDGIIVMKDGRVAETGNFEELMNKKGYFYSLFTVAN